MTTQEQGHSFLQARRERSLNLRALGEELSKSDLFAKEYVTSGDDSVGTSDRKVIEMVVQKQFDIERRDSGDEELNTRLVGKEEKFEEKRRVQRKRVFEL